MSIRAAFIDSDEVDENTFIADYWLEFLSARRDSEPATGENGLESRCPAGLRPPSAAEPVPGKA